MTDTVDQLLQRLQRGTPVEQRTAALKLGMMRNPLVIPDLLRAAETSDNSLRAIIASSLAALGANDRLRAALSHRSPYVRLTAVMALRHTNNPVVVSDLIPMLADDDPAIQAAAVEALRAYHTPEARAALYQNDNPTE